MEECVRAHTGCICRTMSAQKEAVRQQVRLLKAQAQEEADANEAGMFTAFVYGWRHFTYEPHDLI